MSDDAVRVKVRDVDGGVDGAPAWITTFVDMISLLVTFFILLFTFSSIQEYDSFTFPKNLIGTRGTFEEQAKTAISAPQDDVMQSFDLERGARVPHSRPNDMLLENLDDMGQRLTDEHIEFDANDVADGLRLRFDERASFSPGSAHVNGVLAKSLIELGRTMQFYTHTIVVEGHTDSGFQPTPQYPTAQALSLARANAAAAVILSSSDLPPELIQIAGLGSSRSIADENSAATERRVDRRVEILILAMERSRARAVEEEAR